MTVVEPAGTADTAGDTYPRLLRTPRWRWWRPLLGLLALGFGVVFGGVVITLLAVIVATATGASGDSVTEDALDPDTVLGLLANNLILATIIPAAALAVLVVHQERPGWLASVTGRVALGPAGAAGRRWRWWSCSSSAVSVSWCRVRRRRRLDARPTATLVGLLAVILLTTPLQSAAEEVGFRGYLTQAVASWFARPVVGILVGGAVSATSASRSRTACRTRGCSPTGSASGVVASWLAWRTGGLEASVALHTANNLVSLVVSASTGTAVRLADRLVAGLAVRRAGRVDDGGLRGCSSTGLGAPPAGGHRGAVLSATGAVGYPVQRPPTPPPAGRENPWGMG